MKVKQPQTKQPEKVYRSIEEVREHFFPNFYEKEEELEKHQNPETFGTGLAQELLEGIRRELRELSR